MVYFIMGIGFVLPTTAFITAIDYFSYIYPTVNVNRVFTAVRFLISFITLFIIVFWAGKSSAYVRISLGLVLFLVCLTAVPVLDLVYVKGRRGLYSGYYATVAAVGVCGVASALVESGVIGSAWVLQERCYMQAIFAGKGVSGVLVSAMRIITKARYQDNTHGLRSSANLHFSISITIVAICLVCYNMSTNLPIMQYYEDMKRNALDEEKNNKDSQSGFSSRSTLWDTVGTVKWFGFGKFVLEFVSFSLFPGPLTKDVHSYILKDWYPILLIACYRVLDLLGKCTAGIYRIENENVLITASVARFLFYPLFLGCLYGPKFLQTEGPVTMLACLLGLTHGYFATVLMIVAPKADQIRQHTETASIVLCLFTRLGSSTGSILAWFWVI